MNISRSVSTLSNNPEGHLRRNVLVAALGGAIVLAAFGGGSLWYRGGSAGPSAVVQAAAAPVTNGVAISQPAPRYTPHTIYMVGSEEQARAVSVNLSEAAAIRNAAGEWPLLDEVVLVGSDGEAAAVVASAAELNRVLVAQSYEENRVVDLRK